MTSSAAPSFARNVVAKLGGRYSIELGIELDRGGVEIERWFLAATLFSSRIPASVAMRTYRVLGAAGIATVQDVEGWSWDDLVELLDSGGYTRYDYRMASRLRVLAHTVRDCFPDGIGSLACIAGAREMEEALDALPGWGPVTVHLFLRELRGIWPGADPELNRRVAEAARHLGLNGAVEGREGVRWLRSAAEAASLDVRDLEAALIRLSIAHGRHFDACPGGSECVLLRAVAGPSSRRPGRALAGSRT